MTKSEKCRELHISASHCPVIVNTFRTLQYDFGKPFCYGVIAIEINPVFIAICGCMVLATEFYTVGCITNGRQCFLM